MATPTTSLLLEPSSDGEQPGPLEDRKSLPRSNFAQSHDGTGRGDNEPKGFAFHFASIETEPKAVPVMDGLLGREVELKTIT